MKATESMISGNSNALGRCMVVLDGRMSLMAAQLVRMLEKRGFAVDVVTGMREALQHCWRGMPRAVFVPRSLHDGEGAVLIQRLKRMPRAQSCVAIAYGDGLDPADAGRLIWEGAADCIAFPVSESLLEAKLRQSGVLHG